MTSSHGARSLLLVLLLAAAARGQDAGVDPEQLARNEKQVATNGFNVDRTAREYVRILDESLEADMKTWRRGMRILDGGAGSARFLRDVAGRAGDDRPDLIAVGVKKPDVWNSRTAKYEALVLPEGVEYLEGKLGDVASDFALEKRIGLGTIDRIVEVYGASHYAPLDKVLEAYGRLLRPGGELFLHMDPTTRFLDASGADLSPASYLRRIRGMKLVRSLVREDDSVLDRTQLSVVLERTAESLSVPALELRSFLQAAPPRRTFATDLPPLPAPEEIGARALELAKRIARPFVRRFAFPLTRRAPAPAAEKRDLVVLSKDEVLAVDHAEKPSDPSRISYVRHELGAEPREVEEHLGTFDRIFHDAANGDSEEVRAALKRLLKPEGRLDVRPVEPRTGITERLDAHRGQERVRAR